MDGLWLHVHGFSYLFLADSQRSEHNALDHFSYQHEDAAGCVHHHLWGNESFFKKQNHQSTHVGFEQSKSHIPRQRECPWWDTGAHWWPCSQSSPAGPAWFPHRVRCGSLLSVQTSTLSLWLWCRHSIWSQPAELCSGLCTSVNWARGSAPETAEASWLLLSLDCRVMCPNENSFPLLNLFYQSQSAS